MPAGPAIPQELHGRGVLKILPYCNDVRCTRKEEESGEMKDREGEGE